MKGKYITNSIKNEDNKRKKTGYGLRKTLKQIISNTKKHIKKLKPKCKKVAIELAVAAAKQLASEFTDVPTPRVIPVPKTGGSLSLVPIFAGLSATGSLGGGEEGVANAIRTLKLAKIQLKDVKKHKKQTEGFYIGKGLILKPHRDGLGIFLESKKKN